MKKYFILLFEAVALSTSLIAAEKNDSIPSDWNKALDEVVIVAKRPALKQTADRIVYLPKNDQYAVGLNGLELLDRLPRVSVVGEEISVAGKNSVRYIIDGQLQEMAEDAVMMKLKNLQGGGIEKIELLTTPPAKYAAGNNVAYISITTKNESLGYRGNIWGRGKHSDSFGYSLGGNISNTTRKTELSMDASWNDSKGKNDQYREYQFADRLQTSDRNNNFTWRTFGVNGLFKYKFNDLISAGIMLNYSRNSMESQLKDKTTIVNSYMLSLSSTPAYPENALTLTGFIDWKLDTTGKMVSLTYNLFDKRIKSSTEVSTIFNQNDISHLQRDADNNYSINSIKLDVMLPLSSIKIETGTAYTGVGNHTHLNIFNEDQGEMIYNPLQSNSFTYQENTFAVYLSAEKNFTPALFGKLAVRFENTSITGTQLTDNSRFNHHYNYLFPSAVVSYNFKEAGRLSADYSMGITRPTFGDMNPFRYYNTVYDYFTGNPELSSVISHNVGINYSFKGLYAVFYCSRNNDAIGYITRFASDGMQWTTPENCLKTTKTGIYASYNKSFFDCWHINLGGEMFHSHTEATVPNYDNRNSKCWSGKLELNTSVLLTRMKNLIFNLRCSHYFPYQDAMVRYENRTFLTGELRYLALDNRLTVTLSVIDPFNWSITKSTTLFNDYKKTSKVDIHQHAVALRVSYTFGGAKVNNVYRDSKERESHRAN